MKVSISVQSLVRITITGSADEVEQVWDRLSRAGIRPVDLPAPIALPSVHGGRASITSVGGQGLTDDGQWFRSGDFAAADEGRITALSADTEDDG